MVEPPREFQRRRRGGDAFAAGERQVELSTGFAAGAVMFDNIGRR